MSAQQVKKKIKNAMKTTKEAKITVSFEIIKKSNCDIR
jgi:hypothetical protein